MRERKTDKDKDQNSILVFSLLKIDVLLEIARFVVLEFMTRVQMDPAIGQWSRIPQ